MHFLEFLPWHNRTLLKHCFYLICTCPLVRSNYSFIILFILLYQFIYIQFLLLLLNYFFHYFSRKICPVVLNFCRFSYAFCRPDFFLLDLTLFLFHSCITYFIILYLLLILSLVVLFTTLSLSFTIILSQT